MTTKQKIYNISICILAITSVVFSIIDFTNGLTPLQIWIDRIIYVIFILDYVIRITIAKEKKVFVKENIWDLIAIIPFNSALRVFRGVKFVRLLKLTKLLRIGALSARCFKRTKKFLNTNGFKYVLYCTVSAILISSFCMMYFENMTFGNALWWSFVTATTVGYGDISPATNAGRIIASVLMLIGIGLIGSLTSSITSFFLQQDNVGSSNSEKIDMVVTLYDKLTEDEKKTFIDFVMKQK